LDSRTEKKYILVEIDNKSTKAALVDNVNGEYKLVGAATSSTTVEAPYLDVTKGVVEAIHAIEKTSDQTILQSGIPSQDYSLLCSSNASGGLHMVVADLMSMISGESAQRAALGAGALLMDEFSLDDNRPDYQKVSKLRSLKPDILLLAGGTDGGNVKEVLGMTGIIRDADVKARFGAQYQLPVIYAGNIDIQDQVKEVLSDDGYATKLVENVRPVIDKENLGPAREGIYDAYMEHVIIHSPGFEKLSNWTTNHILPSQAALGRILYAYAQSRGIYLIGVDIGSETTDIYSVFNNIFNRSLSADIGLTYGISNIMKETGIPNIQRWLPGTTDERSIRNIVGNLMIAKNENLGSEELVVKSAVAREAIRLGLEEHKKIACRLKGVVLNRTMADMFSQALEATLIDMMKTQVIIGLGDFFSKQSLEYSAAVLIDALQPGGLTEIYIDNTGLMAPLGNLLMHNENAALHLLNDACLSNVGVCIAPRGSLREGEAALTIYMVKGDGSKQEKIVNFGEFRVIHLPQGELTDIILVPNKLDLGAGKGKPVKRSISGGNLGVIIDTRGRPLRQYRKSLSVLDMVNRTDI
jgi:hypothetical protein